MKAATSVHWARRREAGAAPLILFAAWIARHAGRAAMWPVVRGAALYFYLRRRDARQAIARYHERLRAAGGAAPLPRRAAVYGQFAAFGDAMLDALDVWQGRLTRAHVDVHDPDALLAQMGAGRGQLLVCCHVGSPEVCRALCHQARDAVLNVLVHTRHAAAFNRALARAGADTVRLLQVSDLDAPAMLALSRKLERGEWLAIAGDRVPVRGGRMASVDFLGAQARFPQGPWLLAGLLRCPVNLMFCTRIQGRYRVSLERFEEACGWPRGQRDGAVQACVQRYAHRLADECRKAPQQWFNFHDYWRENA
jgi:predicted LPLAT superfamily acyltransferase